VSELYRALLTGLPETEQRQVTETVTEALQRQRDEAERASQSVPEARPAIDRDADAAADAEGAARYG
jgi:ABC-type transporter MlaC component